MRPAGRKPQHRGVWSMEGAVQDTENVRCENTEVIAHLWKWHWRIEAVCETMGVSGTATLARVRGALSALAPVQEEATEDDAEGDDDDLRGAAGVIFGAVAALPFWCLIACGIT